MFPYSWFRLLFRLLFLWPFLLFQLLFPWPTTLLILWPFRLLILWPIRLLILWPIRLLILWPFRLLFREHDAGLAVITPEIRVISVKPTSTPLQYSDQYTHEEAQRQRDGSPELSPLLEGHADDTDVLKADVDQLKTRLENVLHMLDQFERFKFPDKENTQYQHLSNKNLSRLQEVKATLKGLNNHITRVYTLQQDTFHLFSDLKAKNERISELTREILRLGDTRPDASRDDYYFATKFAGVFRAVEEWVYLTFLHADHGQQIQEQQIQEEVVNLLHKTAGAGWQPWLEEEHILLFTGVITEMLVSKVMELPILGMNNPYVALLKPTIEKSFVENTEEDTKWRATTIDILTRSPLFWENFKPIAHDLASDLLTKFALFTKKATAARTKKLAALITQGGEVAMECQREPSQFQFKRFPPGSKCIAEMVSDARSIVSDETLKGEEGKWLVAMTVAPAVVRVTYRSGKEVVVVKAKVVLEELSQEVNGDEGSSGQEGRSEKEESSDDECSSGGEGSSSEDGTVEDMTDEDQDV